MFSQCLTIAKNTFLESVRQPIYFILTAICGLLILLTVWTAAFSMDYSSTAEVSADDKVLLDVGLATVFVCGMLLSAYLATAVISKEIERKTVLTVVSKPVARPTVVIGKYLGVAGAITIAVVIMLMFLLLSVRQGVMSTTADDLDGPVLLVTMLAVGIALGVGIWCNFFYGWSFSQASMLTLCPLSVVAYVTVLIVGKKWNIQPIEAGFKPEIFKASCVLLCSQLVFASVATAASARLGQVMTLVVCCGVFMLGLTSNHFVGRHAFDNVLVARIDSAVPKSEGMRQLDTAGDQYQIKLELDPRVRMTPGSSVYYGPNPNGYALSVPRYPAFAGDVNDVGAVSDRSKPAALAVVNQEGKSLLITRTGAPGAFVSRPPATGDFVFQRATNTNLFAWGVWGIIPNVQSFWLVDAVSQNQPIPLSHVGMVALYAVLQVGVFISLGVILFQRREVG